MTRASAADPLAAFSEPTRAWFTEAFAAPTRAQEIGWRAISAGRHTLLHAPTGSGKTLAAFLWCLDRCFTDPHPAPMTAHKSGGRRSGRPGSVRILYV
ncbi:MAG: DEAD/DEAH box helicase, partial [Chloroflexota bacterium]|nr:DEAD/DEAH box helicase [Chloroflexota bacterium]